VSRRRGPVAALIAIVAAVAVLAVDSYAAPATPSPSPTAEVRATTPLAGAAICAVGTSGETTSTTLSIAGADTARSQPASFEVELLDEGAVTRTPVSQLFPGAAARVAPEVGELGAAVVRWREAPVAVSREWRVEEDEDLPDVTIAGACPTSTSGRSLVPGLSTSGGDEAILRLANPSRSAATIAVSFLGPEGPESPLALRNLSVPGRSVRELTVNEFLPERTDLSAVVDVLSGRLVVEGVQLSRAEIGDVDGGSLLAAAQETAEEWTVPTVQDDGSATSWLWIANPSQRMAEVELTLHTPDGGTVPEGLATTSVAPGTVQRVELAGTFPEDVTEASITARSNGTEIVVSAGTTITADDPSDTATIVQLGAHAPDRSWTVSGGSADGRTERLRIVNPTGAAASLEVDLLVGVSSVEPSELQELELGPGAAIDVDLTDLVGNASSWTAFVRSTGSEVVVGRVGARTDDGDGSLRAIATLGVPSVSWQVAGSGLVSAHRDDLARSLRTRDGVRPLGPLDGIVEDAPPIEPLDTGPGTTPAEDEEPTDLGDVTGDDDPDGAEDGVEPEDGDELDDPDAPDGEPDDADEPDDDEADEDEDDEADATEDA
jgi:hypothetical protein